MGMHFFNLILVFAQKKDYIVMFKNTGPLSVNSNEVHLQGLNSIKAMMDSDDSITNFTQFGVIGRFSKETADRIKNNEKVALVEEDQPVHLSGPKVGNFFDIDYKDISDEDTSTDKFFYKEKSKSSKLLFQKVAPWGVSRVSSSEAGKGNSYRYPSTAGKGVDVYIIDTGIDIRHKEFAGRARWGVNLVKDSPNIDDNGHGTHCAGTIAGRNVGIAKNANVVAVKALESGGSGVISTVIMGIDFVIRDHDRKLDALRKKINKGKRNLLNSEGKKLFDKNSKLLESLKKFVISNEKAPKSVINMSIGGYKSLALEFAIAYAVDFGIHVSVAAGNDSEDACKFSPASSKYALTVGASDKEDKQAIFSNYGACVDIYAPGVKIGSSWIDGRYRITSGTSMAAPHVSGVIALYLGEKNYNPSELKKRILEDAVDKVTVGDEGNYFFSFMNLFKRNGEKYPLVSTRNLLKRIKFRKSN